MSEIEIDETQAPQTGRGRRLTRDEINRLPLASYGGSIEFVRSQGGISDAVAALRRETVLGFDTEKRPSFRKGEFHPPALIQLAGEKVVFIFQLKNTGLPQQLADILADRTIVKAGVAVARDIKELRALTPFEPRGFMDLGDSAKEAGVEHHGLRGLAAVLLNCRISKGAQLTNWASQELSTTALRYAATDAWMGRRIYLEMIRFKTNRTEEERAD